MINSMKDIPFFADEDGTYHFYHTPNIYLEPTEGGVKLIGTIEGHDYEHNLFIPYPTSVEEINLHLERGQMIIEEAICDLRSK